MTKICKYCGDEFIPIRKTQVYCCKECRNIDRTVHLPIIKCCLCGKEFQRKQTAQKYCSFECGEMAKRQQYKEYATIKKRNFKNKVCVICGKEFTPKDTRQVTCGAIECQKALALDRRKTKPKQYEYLYKKDEGIEITPPKKKKKYSLKEWNSLTPAERWSLMMLNEIIAENIKYHIPSYGKSETLARQGRLPDDYGKRERKSKQCPQ